MERKDKIAILKKGTGKILDAVYPSSIYCLCCGKAIDKSRSYSLCDSCISNMNWAVGRTCSKCGKILQDNWIGSRCADCMKLDHYFEKGYACCQYGAYARAIIFSYKYNGKNYVGKFMGRALAERLMLVEARWDYLVPVPTEKTKERERGFDHTFLMAKETGKLLGIKAIPALVRHKKTIPQRGLDPVARRENVRDAISVSQYYKETIKGKDILLIDDIYTTGATTDECSKALLLEGARRVDVATFAAGGNRHNQPED